VLAWSLFSLGELRVVNRRFATPGTRAVDGGQYLVGTLRAVARRLLGPAELDLEIDEVGHRSKLLIRWRMSSPRRASPFLQRDPDALDRNAPTRSHQRHRHRRSDVSRLRRSDASSKCDYCATSYSRRS